MFRLEPLDLQKEKFKYFRAENEKNFKGNQ